VEFAVNHDQQVVPLGSETITNKKHEARDLLALCLEQELQLSSMLLFILLLEDIPHELSHAGMVALFDASKIRGIHIFDDAGAFMRAPRGSKSPDLFAIGTIHVHKALFDGGYADYDNFDEPYKNGLVCATGALGASTVYVFCLSMIMLYCHACDGGLLADYFTTGWRALFEPFQRIVHTKNLSAMRKRALLNVAAALFFAIILQLFYGLTPSPLLHPDAGGDGALAWNCFRNGKMMALSSDDSKDWALQTVRWLALLGELGCFGFLAKRYYDAQKEICLQEAPALNVDGGAAASLVPVAVVSAV
jgi:hypothetical protein